MKKILIEGKNIFKTFALGNVKNKVIDDVSISIYDGDFTVIMGSSGAGKSTLLYLLSGMDSVSKGSVFYKEKDITKLKEEEMAFLRTKDFGFVFQATHLISNLTLFENVVVAGYLNKEKSTEEIKTRTKMLLEKMNIKGATERLPSHTSGGEAQRAAIARSLINEPSIIFADEPTGALNKRNSMEVLDLLTELNREGQSILMVTHDIKAAIRANRLLYLEDGKIVGEKMMGSYQKNSERQREDEITTWLKEKNW